MMILKKIDPLSFAKVTAIMGAILGLIAGLLFIIITIIIASIIGAYLPSMADFSSSDLPSEPSFLMDEDTGLLNSDSGGSDLSYSDYSDAGADLGIMPMFPTKPKWSNLIIFPILYCIFFFIGGLIFAWLYNLIAKLIGGVKLDLEFEQIKENKIQQTPQVQQPIYQQQTQPQQMQQAYQQPMPQNHPQQFQQQTHRPPVQNPQVPQQVRK